MEQKNVSKITAIFLAIIIIVVSLFSISDWKIVGIYEGCDIANRFIYPFFHINIFHALINAWALLSIVFLYRAGLWRLIVSYLLSTTIPINLFATLGISASTPTVGLSGMIFLLLGSYTFEVQRKLYYQSWMVMSLAIGFLIPNSNVWVHIYCYLLGVIVSFFNKPINIK